MKQYNVNGMSCAACSTRVEKAVSKVEGVTSCSVSLLTNSMGVEGDAKRSRHSCSSGKSGIFSFCKGERIPQSRQNMQKRNF